MPQKECFGFNSVNSLRKILASHNPTSIFLVTGKASYEKSGAKAALGKILKNFNIARFCDFEENPKIENIKKGIKIFKKYKCGFVVAAGGGVAIDIAKSVNILSVNSESPKDYIFKKKLIQKKGKPLVAIPTTAGTGSEATKFVVVYIDKTKYSLEHDFILPDYAIVDPQFTMSLPGYVTASTGMDALSQAIESYWSVNSTNLSKKYAGKAIQLAIKNLPIAVNNPSRKSREAMSKAAHLAGKAINITRTTAPHAISYPITSYFSVPHGHAVALTLASVLKYNSQVTEQDLLDKRGITYVKKNINKIVNLLGAGNIDEACNKIKNLMAEIGLSAKLSGLGMAKRGSLDLIIKHGFNPSRINNNPRRLTEEVLRKMLNDLM